ncbi:peroxiredoxin [Buchnera aphidicola]|uniref:peroxiredoxin n=1 Tax=Buchnera aphidicola TaxID=9 RepID=UPI0031B7FA6B
MNLITQHAPNFVAPAILADGTITEEFNLKKETKNKSVVLFFWPMDFTYVCPTEIIEFNLSYLEFQKKNTEIIGISRDSVFVHQAWKNTEIKKGGIGKIQYPLISDIKGEIQEAYDVVHPKFGVSLRATFIIDKNGIIRNQIINDLQFGRNIKEILRIIDAIYFHEKHGDVCPANWEIGKKSIQPSQEGLIKYFNKK